MGRVSEEEIVSPAEIGEAAKVENGSAIGGGDRIGLDRLVGDLEGEVGGVEGRKSGEERGDKGVAELRNRGFWKVIDGVILFEEDDALAGVYLIWGVM